jgi:MarR family transcriptional regulator, 2-MHQ and catechol-resistance regulon repressor
MRLKSSSSSGEPPVLKQVMQPEDQPFTDMARALLRAAFLFSNHPERPFQAYDLNLAQVDVLIALAGADEAGLTCSEIAGKTLITKGGITGVLDRLEARGLVKRVPSRDDRRSVHVRLSAKGVEFFRKLYPELVRSNRKLFGKAFKPEQMNELGKLLDQLVRSLEA